MRALPLKTIAAVMFAAMNAIPANSKIERLSSYWPTAGALSKVVGIWLVSQIRLILWVGLGLATTTGIN